MVVVVPMHQDASHLRAACRSAKHRSGYDLHRAHVLARRRLLQAELDVRPAPRGETGCHREARPGFFEDASLALAPV